MVLMLGLLFLVHLHANLILNSDFEYHRPIPQFLSIFYNNHTLYYYFENDFVTYSWYDAYGVQFEFITIYTTQTSYSIAADLCARASTKLCQNVIFQSTKYEISYDICPNELSTIGYYSLLIGNMTMIQNLKINQIGCNHNTIIFNFLQQGQQSICFTGYQSLTNKNFCSFGPVLDNVTLIKFQTINTTIKLKVKLTHNAEVIVDTNLLLDNSTSQPFKLSTITTLFINFTVQNITKSVQLLKSQKNYLQFKLIEFEQLYQKTIRVSINSTEIGYNIYNFISGQVTYIQNLNSEQKKLISWFNQLNKPVSLRIKDTIKFTKLLGFGYFIFDMFAFWQIAIFHNYLLISTPSFVKLFAQNNFKNLMSSSIFQQFQIDQYVYHTFTIPTNEKVPKTNNQWLWFRQLGFTSNFYINNVQCIFLLIIGLLKSLFLHIVYLLTGWRYYNMKKHWYGNFALDLLNWVPFLVLTPCLMLYNWSLCNPFDKVNFMLNIISLFLSIITPFLFLTFNLPHISPKSKYKQKLLSKRREIISVFLDMIFVVALTIATSIGIKQLFLICSLTLVICKIIVIIKCRHSLYKIEFVIKLLSQIIWILYTLIFIYFRITEFMIEKFYLDSENTIYIDWSKYMGIISMIVFILGSWIQVLHLIFIIINNIILAFTTLVKYIKSKIPNKIQQTTQPQKKTSKQKKQEKQNKQEKLNKQEKQKPQQNKKIRKQIKITVIDHEKYKDQNYAKFIFRREESQSPKHSHQVNETNKKGQRNIKKQKDKNKFLIVQYDHDKDGGRAQYYID